MRFEFEFFGVRIAKRIDRIVSLLIHTNPKEKSKKNSAAEMNTGEE